jgi:hypothetical protein
MFCFEVLVVMISFQKTANLCIIQKAPCLIPCNYVLKEFVVYISHIDEVTTKMLMFLFVQASAVGVLNVDKQGACPMHHDEYRDNSYRSSTL